jgi:predicted lipoprotein with Yx(FWY)xxD motif
MPTLAASADAPIKNSRRLSDRRSLSSSGLMPELAQQAISEGARDQRAQTLRRVKVLLVGALTLAGSVLAPATVAAQRVGVNAAAASAPTVRLQQTGLGEILVDGSGHTLYLFTRDRHDKDSCAKVSGCLETWPALTTTRKPVAGAHVRASLLGTVELRGRVRQVTYAGHPLYTYALDFTGRSTFNIGSDEYGGEWLAVNAAGEAVN